MTEVVAIMNLQSQNKALIAERDALQAEVERYKAEIEQLRDALKSIAFDMEDGLQSNVIAYECVARTALEGGDT